MMLIDTPLGAVSQPIRIMTAARLAAGDLSVEISTVNGGLFDAHFMHNACTTHARLVREPQKVNDEADEEDGMTKPRVGRCSATPSGRAGSATT
jgi:hypothetical protein